jgi:hypothetical protein
VSRSGPRTSRRTPEREVVRTAAAFLEKQGYRVYPNPDRTDYFDLVARRGEEVGLIEAKVSGSREVLLQALRRRAWGDWVAVVLPSERSAERLAERTAGARASRVGVWVARDDGTVRVVRAAALVSTPGEEDPFSDHRRFFRSVLDRIDSGELPPNLRWDGVGRAVRRASGGRGFKEWRLDEPTTE